MMMTSILSEEVGKEEGQLSAELSTTVTSGPGWEVDDGDVRSRLRDRRRWRQYLDENACDNDFSA